MKFDCIFFDSGGTLYGPGTGTDPSPARVAAGNIERVRALLGSMGVAAEPGLLKETITRQAPANRNSGSHITFSG